MYTVVWSDDALERVVQLWAGADTDIRVAINAAMHRIDKRLGDDPVNAGESRDADKSVCLEFPLGVLYKIDAQKKEIHIGKVWTYRRRR